MRGAVALLLVAASMVACRSKKAEAPEPVAAAPAQAVAPALALAPTVSTPTVPAPAATPIAPGAQMPKDATHAGVKAPRATAQPSSVPATGEGLTGKVLERLDASPYCYLRLKIAKGEVWAAVPEAKVEKGAEVTVANPMLMTDFESKTLKRTFAEVYFGTLASTGAPTAAAGSNPHAKVGQTAATVKVGKVEKAGGDDARTVSEIWIQKGNLKEKSVTIRGKVVKFSAGVMGKNWMHLQDGSGDGAKGTNDITVTSLDEVAMGDTVTIRGVVRTNKDFGAGYSYAVIIEDAKVIKN